MSKKIVVGSVSAALMAIVIGVSSPEIGALEGQELRAYKDIAGVLTVCNGHTGKDIVVNKVYTQDECKALTEKDAKAAMAGVLKISPHLVWHPMQLAAAVSFTYNVGIGTYTSSSVARLFNSGDFKGACNYLTKYVYVKKVVVQGLVNRRAREQQICLSTLTSEGVKDVVEQH